MLDDLDKYHVMENSITPWNPLKTIPVHFEVWATLHCQTCPNILKPCEHAHKSWGQGEKVGSTNLSKFDSGQRGFSGILVNQNDLNWHEALHGDNNMHFWLAGFSLDFYVKSLKCEEMVLGGFVQYFEHDHVLKLLYMEDICPLSFPNFCQIFLEQ